MSAEPGPTRVVVIGLGRMGMPIARHLIEHGFDVRGHDRSAPERAQLVALGGVVTDFPHDLDEADFVILMVGHEDQVEELLLQPGGLCDHVSNRAVVLVMSTISPIRLERIAAQPAAQGLRILDVPVCRGDIGARSGELLALASGAAEDYVAAEPVLAAFCSDTFYLGVGLGLAQVAKSVNDMILWAAVVANYEGFALAESWGIDIEQMRSILAVSTGDNWSARHWERRANWPWSIKDMRIFIEVAAQRHLDVPVGRAVETAVADLPILRHA